MVNFSINFTTFISVEIQVLVYLLIKTKLLDRFILPAIQNDV
jgi:hypothetical protein